MLDVVSPSDGAPVTLPLLTIMCMFSLPHLCMPLRDCSLSLINSSFLGSSQEYRRSSVLDAQSLHLFLADSTAQLKSWLWRILIVSGRCVTHWIIRWRWHHHALVSRTVPKRRLCLTWRLGSRQVILLIARVCRLCVESRIEPFPVVTLLDRVRR